MARILLLEDERGFQELLVRVLEMAGHQVVACAAGDEVLQILSEPCEFDLFLFDQVLPDTLGLDLLENLREWGSQTPAIIMTGIGADVDQVRQAMNARALDFLVKPFSPVSDLLPNIERSLAVWQQRRSATSPVAAVRDA